jgi:hypothetical protein
MKRLLTRRDLTLRIAAVTALAPLVLARAAAAGTGTPKSEVKYQFTPNGVARCGACVSFIPGDSNQGAGTCKIVQGPIPQNGWCVLFSKKA